MIQITVTVRAPSDDFERAKDRAAAIGENLDLPLAGAKTRSYSRYREITLIFKEQPDA